MSKCKCKGVAYIPSTLRDEWVLRSVTIKVGKKLNNILNKWSDEKIYIKVYV